MGAKRATRSSRRPLLGACVRRDQEGRTEGFDAPARRAPKLTVVDVSCLAKQAAAAGIHTPAGRVAVLSARLPTCEARKVRMHAGRAGTSFPVVLLYLLSRRSGFDTYASLANTQR